MKRLGFLLLLAAASCAPSDTWSNRVEPMPEPEPIPEKLLRKPADFRIYDPATRKEFFLHFYEDSEVKDYRFTLINHNLPEGQRTQRPATEEEADYALAVFIATWLSEGEAGKLWYFNFRHAEDRHRRDTLIDDQLHYKKLEKKDLEEQVLALRADAESRHATKTYPAGDEKLWLAELAAVERQLALRRRRLLLAEGQILVLERLRNLRDAQYGRLVSVFADTTIRVDDLVASHPPEQLIQTIRSQIAPESWQHPDARIDFADGHLAIRQKREIVLQVRDHVDWLRSEVVSREKSKQEAVKPVDQAPK